MANGSDTRGKAARPHAELLAEIMDSRIPKTEREHAAAREIERLTRERDELRGLVAEFVESCDSMDDDPIDGEPLMVRARRALARIDAALAEGAEKRLPLSVCASCGHTWTEDTVWCARCAERI